MASDRWGEVLTEETAAEMAEKAREWAASPEGQRAIREGLERAHQTAWQFSEGSRWKSQEERIMDLERRVKALERGV